MTETMQEKVYRIVETEDGLSLYKVAGSSVLGEPIPFEHYKLVRGKHPGEGYTLRRVEQKG
jgi:hypothetical protein